MIELLAIVAVMGIMLLVSLVNYNPAKNDAKLKAAQREVASAIQTAKSYALQGKTVSGNVPKCWGFIFTAADTYLIFPSDCTTDNVAAAETYKLSNGVQASNSPLTNTRIVFSVPNGTASNAATINLSLGGLLKTVTETTGGVVTEN